MKKKVFLTLLVALLSLSLLAAGVREVKESESIVRVVSVEEDRITAQNTDGSVVIYHISEETAFENTSLSTLKEGDVLIIENNGISTMSLPPQMYAINIRNINIAREIGFYNTPFAEVSISADTFDITELVPRFSYSYGYLSMDNLITQGLVVDGRYFTRGVLDAIDLREDTLLTYDEMLLATDEYFNTVYSVGTVGDAGDVFTDLNSLTTLEAPSTLSEEFAYSYGFILSYQIMMNGLELDREAFPLGMLTRLFDMPSLLTDDEMTEAINNYINYLNEVYMEWLTQLAQENLEKAETFLNENALKEGVIVLSDSLQIEFRAKAEEESAMPTSEDTVVVNYTLRNQDGNVLESNEGVSFPLSGVIAGFRDAILEMHVGDSLTAYIHPSAGYGESGAGNIAPNELLIFDINLVSIAE